MALGDDRPLFRYLIHGKFDRIRIFEQRIAIFLPHQGSTPLQILQGAPLRRICYPKFKAVLQKRISNVALPPLLILAS